jgi:aromatic ring-opening dioxygenase LigB subunit
MIVFSAFVPHTPLLIPSIGKDKQPAMAKTTEALGILAKRLMASAPDTIVVIASHGEQPAGAFSINLQDNYMVDLAEFGEHGNTPTFRPDFQTIDTIQRHVRRQGIPLIINSLPALDYGSAVPLLLLTAGLENFSIIPISYSGLAAETHLRFGQALKEILGESPKRVAVIAAGDLSHCLTEDAPAGYQPEGAAFDQTLTQCLKALDFATLAKISPAKLQAAEQCAYEPAMILGGIIGETKLEPEILAYEAPFGVGYLVVDFGMK